MFQNEFDKKIALMEVMYRNCTLLLYKLHLSG